MYDDDYASDEDKEYSLSSFFEMEMPTVSSISKSIYQKLNIIAKKSEKLTWIELVIGRDRYFQYLYLGIVVFIFILYQYFYNNLLHDLKKA